MERDDSAIVERAAIRTSELPKVVVLANEILGYLVVRCIG
jgi:hypothetical protein